MQANAIDSPAEIVKTIKGGTSHKLRELFPTLVETRWLKSFWAGGYFAGTVGTRNLKDVKTYIINQSSQSMINEDEIADF